MDNLLGAAAGGWLDLLTEPGARVHLYGKREIRHARKLGHVTRLSPR
jgi:5-(carboxyamino)imidazole ribonucleotide synthase